MDYMWEELSRQRAALAALVLGGGRARGAGEGEDAGAETAWTETDRAETPEAWLWSRGWAEGLVPAGDGGRFSTAGRTGRSASPEDGGDPPAEVFFGGDGAWPAGKRGFFPEDAGKPAERRGLTGQKRLWRSSPGLAEDGDGGVRLVTEVVHTAAAPAAGARELSLAVQRDARRYDGGFSLY